MAWAFREMEFAMISVEANAFPDQSPSLDSVEVTTGIH